MNSATGTTLSREVAKYLSCSGVSCNSKGLPFSSITITVTRSLHPDSTDASSPTHKITVDVPGRIFFMSIPTKDKWKHPIYIYTDVKHDFIKVNTIIKQTKKCFAKHFLWPPTCYDTKERWQLMKDCHTRRKCGLAMTVWLKETKKNRL